VRPCKLAIDAILSVAQDRQGEHEVARDKLSLRKPDFESHSEVGGNDSRRAQPKAFRALK
jgi:hypothetical protein